LVKEEDIPPISRELRLLGEVYALEAVDADGNPVTDFGNDWVTLTMSYDRDDLNGLDEQSLPIYYYDGAWMPLLSIVDPMTRTGTAETHHFTPFGVFAAIPEPGTFMLVGLGVLGLLVLACQRRHRRK
jgi:hypothetical protein